MTVSMPVKPISCPECGVKAVLVRDVGIQITLPIHYQYDLSEPHSLFNLIRSHSTDIAIQQTFEGNPRCEACGWEL